MRPRAVASPPTPSRSSTPIARSRSCRSTPAAATIRSGVTPRQVTRMTGRSASPTASSRPPRAANRACGPAAASTPRLAPSGGHGVFEVAVSAVGEGPGAVQVDLPRAPRSRPRRGRRSPTRPPACRRREPPLQQPVAADRQAARDLVPGQVAGRARNRVAHHRSRMIRNGGAHTWRVALPGRALTSARRPARVQPAAGVRSSSGSELGGHGSAGTTRSGADDSRPSAARPALGQRAPARPGRDAGSRRQQRIGEHQLGLTPSAGIAVQAGSNARHRAPPAPTAHSHASVVSSCSSNPRRSTATTRATCGRLPSRYPSAAPGWCGTAGANDRAVAQSGEERMEAEAGQAEIGRERSGERDLGRGGRLDAERGKDPRGGVAGEESPADVQPVRQPGVGWTARRSQTTSALPSVASSRPATTVRPPIGSARSHSEARIHHGSAHQHDPSHAGGAVLRSLGELA